MNDAGNATRVDDGGTGMSVEATGLQDSLGSEPLKQRRVVRSQQEIHDADKAELVGLQAISLTSMTQLKKQQLVTRIEVN